MCLAPQKEQHDVVFLYEGKGCRNQEITLCCVYRCFEQTKKNESLRLRLFHFFCQKNMVFCHSVGLNQTFEPNGFEVFSS